MWWMMIPAVMSAAGTLLGADANSKAAKAEQAQLNQQAMGERASASRAAAEADRQSRLMASAALAANSTSGGGFADPTFVNSMAAIAAEGEYNALSALYEGETQARSTEYAGRVRRAEAKRAKRESILTAGAQLGQGALDSRSSSSMYNKYGGGGFKGANSGYQYSGVEAARKGFGTTGRIGSNYR